MTEILHTKYRPRRFREVLGQEPVIKSLEAIVARGSSHAFLFCGPSGCGKTTIARITANELGCRAKSILEIDAATHTGIDDMREIQKGLQYHAFGESSCRAVIIDECHSLSKQAWQSLLKIVEEPPSHVYWFMCTTEEGKVPKTIKTRCTSFTLRLVSDDNLRRVVNRVIKKQEIELAPGVLDVIVKEADGSPRQALVNLAACVDVADKKSAITLLRSAMESDGVIELCRFLVAGGSWAKAMAIVSKLEDQNPESIRIIVMNYMAKVAKGSKTRDQVAHALTILDSFSESYNPSDKMAPLYLSIGRVLFDA